MEEKKRERKRRELTGKNFPGVTFATPLLKKDYTQVGIEISRFFAKEVEVHIHTWPPAFLDRLTRAFPTVLKKMYFFFVFIVKWVNKKEKSTLLPKELWRDNLNLNVNCELTLVKRHATQHWQHFVLIKPYTLCPYFGKKKLESVTVTFHLCTKEPGHFEIFMPWRSFLIISACIHKYIPQWKLKYPGEFTTTPLSAAWFSELGYTEKGNKSLSHSKVVASTWNSGETGSTYRV